MLLPTLIKFAESGVNMLSRPGTSAAKFDEEYYDTGKLSTSERQQAMAVLAEQNVPEGSIFIMVPELKNEPFIVVPDPNKDKIELTGRERGREVARLFLKHPKIADIETVVVAGCASSPLGAAAFGKAVAEISKKPVAAIVAGEGAFDQWMEVASGAMLMGPMANALNTFDQLLELTAKVNQVGAKIYLQDLTEAMQEAATLYALLEARLVDRKFEKLNMIVVHSKGCWPLLVALLNVEFELADKIAIPERPIIDVVTLGNPVHLPHLDPMGKLFRYHQCVGDIDKLAHNTSVKAWQLHFSGAKRVDWKEAREYQARFRLGSIKGENPPKLPFEPNEDPDVLFNDTEHHLFCKKCDSKTGEEIMPYHMPLELILPMIR